MKNACHITIGERSWCEWTGCSAGAVIASKTGVHTCAMPSLRIGRAMAERLAPHFREGAVKVALGPCPHATHDEPEPPKGSAYRRTWAATMRARNRLAPGHRLAPK